MNPHTNPATAPAPTTTLALAGFDAPTQAAIDKMNQLLADLRSAFTERDVEAQLLVLAYLCGEHVLLLGPHGTGKTLLATTFMGALGINPDQLYTYLLGKFTMPDEVFGPKDLPSLKQGISRRNTAGQLPEAVGAVLDECFKCNSSILNSLLTILNERYYDNPRRQQVPLEICVGLSNELPEDGPQGPLAPLYDRFLFRRWTSYISRSSGDAWSSLMADPQAAPATSVQVSRQEAQLVRAAASRVNLRGQTSFMDAQGQPMPLVDVVRLKLKEPLEDDHGLVVSDRRWRKALKAVQAHAVLHGRTVATVADLAPLAHCLWDEPEDAVAVQQAVDKLVDPDLGKARRLYAQALEQYQQIPANEPDLTVWVDAAAKAGRKVNSAMREIGRLHQSPAVAALGQKCREMYDAIAAEQNRRTFG